MIGENLYLTTKQKRRAIISFFDDLKRGKLEKTTENIKRAEKMLNMLVQDNPFFEDKADLLVNIVPLEKTGETEVGGRYLKGTGKMEIDEDLVFSGKVGKMLEVIGHESRHFKQERAIVTMNTSTKEKQKIDASQREQFETMASDYNGMQFDEVEFSDMMSFLKKLPASGYLNYYASLSSEDQAQQDKFMGLSLYFNLKHEVDARKQGYEYCKKIVNSISQDTEASNTLKDSLESDLFSVKDYFEQMQSIEKTSQNMATKFYDAIKQITVNEMLEEAVLQREENRDADGETIAKLDKNIKQVVGLILKEKSKKEKVECLYLSMELGVKSVGDVVISSLASNEKFTMEQQQKIQLAVIDQLENGELPPSSYGLDYEKILSPSQSIALINKLLEKDQLKNASSFMRSYHLEYARLTADEQTLSKEDKGKLKDVESVLLSYQKTIYKKANEFVARFNAGDKTLCYKNYIDIFTELRHVQNLVEKGSKENKVQQDFENIQREVISASIKSKSQEEENYKRIYGDAAFLELKGKRDFIALLEAKQKAARNESEGEHE